MTISVDTNVLVRMIVTDGEQSVRARNLFARDQIVIGHIVLLETTWVLGDSFGFDDSNIVTSLRTLLGLPNVRTPDAWRVKAALDAVDAGLEFADALHLFCLHGAERFATFDKALMKRASRLEDTPVLFNP